MAALFLGLVLTFAGPTTVAAQLGTLVGRVVDHGTGQDLPGVAVTLRATAQRVVTDEAGRFMFTQLGAGTHWLNFRFLGAEPLPGPAGEMGRDPTSDQLLCEI